MHHQIRHQLQSMPHASPLRSNRESGRGYATGQGLQHIKESWFMGTSQGRATKWSARCQPEKPRKFCAWTTRTICTSDMSALQVAPCPLYLSINRQTQTHGGEWHIEQPHSERRSLRHGIGKVRDRYKGGCRPSDSRKRRDNHVQTNPLTVCRPSSTFTWVTTRPSMQIQTLHSVGLCSLPSAT